MKKPIFLSGALVTLLIPPIGATPDSVTDWARDSAQDIRRATITGGGSGERGKCTMEVVVDGAAEVEVSGDTGRLRTLSGQKAFWRRFQCTEPLPFNPGDFRFIGVDGRGSVRLLRDPRNNRGDAVVRIDDPRGGREGYTFDFQWRGSGRGGWPPAPPQPPPGRGPGRGGFPMAKAIRLCQDSVTDRLNRDGYPYVTFERTIPDDSPGRSDWVVGTVSGRNRFATTRFSFSCSVDFGSGIVRSVDIRRRY